MATWTAGLLTIWLARPALARSFIAALMITSLYVKCVGEGLVSLLACYICFSTSCLVLLILHIIGCLVDASSASHWLNFC